MQMMDDGKEIGDVRLQLAQGDRPASEDLLRPTVVADAAMNKRSQQGEAMSNAGMSGQQLAQPHPGDARGDRLEGTAVLAGRARLWVVGLQMTRAAVEPNHEKGMAFLVRPACLGSQAEQVRQGQ